MQIQMNKNNIICRKLLRLWVSVYVMLRAREFRFLSGPTDLRPTNTNESKVLLFDVIVVVSQNH